MKELGEYLKNTRIENGVDLEEAAEDLNMSKDDIENIEEGNVRAFKDILNLKTKMKEYAKYLGLDSESVADEFNDFLFEHTSKINLNDILEAQKKRENEEKKVVSPYTVIKTRKLNYKGILTFALIILFFILLLLILKKVTEPRLPDRNIELLNKIVEEGYYDIA